MRSSGTTLSRLLLIAILAPLLLLFPPQAAYPQDDSPTIHIVGGEEFSSQRLQEAGGQALQALRSGRGGAADAADAAYNMETWIQEQGYPDARVQVRMVDETPAGELRVRSSEAWDSVDRLELVVKPGKPVVLGEVSFSGTEAFERARLRFYFPQGAEVPYRKSEIEEAVNQIFRLYEVKGYAESSVGPANVSRRESNGVIYYDVSVPVEEGPRYTNVQVLVRSEELPTEETRRLEKLIRLEGRPYYPRQATLGALTLRKHLGEMGYKAQVEHSTELGPAGEARIIYRVKPGPLLVLDKVVVSNRGDKPLRTKRSFIRAFLPLEPGDPVDLSALEETESKLYGLGVFALVDVSPQLQEVQGAERTTQEGPSNREGRSTIVDIAVEELRTQYLEVAAGWGSYEQLRGSVTYTDRNLFGRGRSWSTTLEGSFKTYGTQMSITDSLLFGPASTIRLTGSYQYRDAISYDRTIARVEASIVYRLSRLWTFRTAYAFARSRVTNVEGSIPGIEDPDLTTGRIQLAGDYDSRDSVVIPQRGGYFLFSPLLASPLLGSDLLFTGANAKAVRHLRLSRRLTLSLSGSYRLRYQIGSEDPLPIQERLFLGGANNVRSFTLDTLGLVNSNGDPQGGMSSVEATAELRARLFGKLHGALFYDYGYLASQAFTLSVDSGHAVGIGLRYYLPVGPIRLDYAYNPGERYAAERPWALHLAIGFSY